MPVFVANGMQQRAGAKIMSGHFWLPCLNDPCTYLQLGWQLWYCCDMPWLVCHQVLHPLVKGAVIFLLSLLCPSPFLFFLRSGGQYFNVFKAQVLRHFLFVLQVAGRLHVEVMRVTGVVPERVVEGDDSSENSSESGSLEIMDNNGDIICRAKKLTCRVSRPPWAN